MATPQHTPQGRGFQEFYGYFQHANNYWTKGTDLPSTGEVDICLNHFTDLTVENKTYRGGELDPAALNSSCSDSGVDDPTCYESYLFKMQGLKVINNHDPTTMGPLFYMHAFHLVHTPLDVPVSYLLEADARLKQAGGFAFDDEGRRNYSAMVCSIHDGPHAYIYAQTPCDRSRSWMR
jgi:arylsulfatase I/J